MAAIRLEWDFKDPDEVLDFDIDWESALTDEEGNVDVINASDWSLTVAGGLTIDSEQFTNQATKIWLSDGTLGANCELLNRITTTGGRTLDQTVFLKIRKR